MLTISCSPAPGKEFHQGFCSMFYSTDLHSVWFCCQLLLFCSAKMPFYSLECVFWEAVMSPATITQHFDILFRYSISVYSYRTKVQNNKQSKWTAKAVRAEFSGSVLHGSRLWNNLWWSELQLWWKWKPVTKIRIHKCPTVCVCECVCMCMCGAECDGNLVYERINRRLFSVLISASASKGLSLFLSLSFSHTHTSTTHFSLTHRHAHTESTLSSEEEPIVCDES